MNVNRVFFCIYTEAGNMYINCAVYIHFPENSIVGRHEIFIFFMDGNKFSYSDF